MIDFDQIDDETDMRVVLELMKVQLYRIPDCAAVRLAAAMVGVPAVAVLVALGATWGTISPWWSAGLAVIALWVSHALYLLLHRAWHAGAAHAYVAGFESNLDLFDAMVGEADDDDSL